MKDSTPSREQAAWTLRPLLSAVLLLALLGRPAAGGDAAIDNAVEELVSRHARELLPSDGAGGLAVVLRLEGRSLFFSYGNANLASKLPVTPDSLFNLGSIAKAFDATLLADAVVRYELSLDDPVAKYVIELQRGRDIRKVTLGQLASFTSGLVLPQDHPPWPKKTYTQAGYLRYLQRWTLKKGHSPGKQVIHAQSSFVLLRLALERRLGAHYADLMERRLLGPLGLASTALPVAGDARSHPRGRLPSALVSRAVQGYAEDGTPTGVPGDLQGYYHWRGAGQMYSSARDMAVFLAVHLGDRSDYAALQEATKLSQRGVLPFPERSVAALAWERHQQDGFEIVDRYGGLNNATAIAAMIPARQLGIVILCNRGNQDVATAAHAILTELADR